MSETIHSWAFERPINSSFATPRGLRGRLAGLYMRLTLDPAPLLDVLSVRPGDRVLEVGFGPGVLLRALADGTGAAVVHGVDPSAEMRRDAAALNRAAVRAGRVVLHAGTAACTGLDGPFERIVSVHTVALWPELDAGLDELRRLLAPGGTLVLAWHGGRGTTRLARSLRLPDDKLARLRGALERRFDDVVHVRQDRDDAFRARGRAAQVR